MGLFYQTYMVWTNQGAKYKWKTIKLLKSYLINIYAQCWWKHADRPDSKLRTYKTFKTCSFLENYLLHIPNVKLRNEFTKLRISSHRLQIETGRFTRPRKTPVNERLCKFCNTGDVEDEEHFILSCPFYSNERASLYTKLNSFSTFNSLSTQEKFHFIMSYNEGDIEVLSHIIQFVNSCCEKRRMAQV